MNKNKVAVVQFSTEASLKENFEKIEVMIAQAVKDQAKMILFPEEFLTHKMPSDEKKNLAQPLEKNILVSKLSFLIQKYNIALLAGTLPLKVENKNNEKYYNSSIFFNARGEIAAIYHKIHLFDVKLSDDLNQNEYLESNLVDCGSDIIVADTPIGKLGLSVCYDIRFPELYRKQIKQAMQVIAVPSAFTVETGQAHWEILLRARAIENLSYVLAPAQMGERYDGRKTYGHAMIISPWGEVIQHSQTQEGVIYAELDLSAQEILRSSFPALNHIKLI